MRPQPLEPKALQLIVIPQIKKVEKCGLNSLDLASDGLVFLGSIFVTKPRRKNFTHLFEYDLKNTYD